MRPTDAAGKPLSPAPHDLLFGHPKNTLAESTNSPLTIPPVVILLFSIALTYYMNIRLTLQVHESCQTSGKVTILSLAVSCRRSRQSTESQPGVADGANTWHYKDEVVLS